MLVRTFGLAVVRVVRVVRVVWMRGACSLWCRFAQTVSMLGMFLSALFVTLVKVAGEWARLTFFFSVRTGV